LGEGVMVPSVAPCAIAAATRSVSPPIRKLAGRLLGCTCAAALWLNGSVDELWAHERYSYHLKQHEWGPQEAPPAVQRDRRQTRTKRRHGTQDQVHQKRGKANQSAKQKSHTKTARHRRPETKNATKAAVRLSRSTASGRGNLKAAHAKSRTKTVEHRRPETKAASRARNQSNFAGYHHSAARTRSDRSTRAATDRRSRTKTGQHRRQHDKTAINHLAPTKSAGAAAATRPAQVDTRTAVVPDPALAVGSVPQAADARRVP
jgi:hypothetical protein